MNSTYKRTLNFGVVRCNDEKTKIRYEKAYLCVNLCLRVLGPSHVNSTLTEYLTFHVNTVLADKSESTLAATYTASASTFGVVVWVSVCEFLGSHCESLKERRIKNKTKNKTTIQKIIT